MLKDLERQGCSPSIPGIPVHRGGAEGREVTFPVRTWSAQPLMLSLLIRASVDYLSTS